jgi:hypothetical protein
VVAARNRPVRADRRAHELAELGQQAVADRLEDLVVGDDLALADGLADLVGAEAVGGRESEPSPGDDEAGCDCAGRDRPHLEGAEA